MNVIIDLTHSSSINNSYNFIADKLVFIACIVYVL